MSASKTFSRLGLGATLALALLSAHAAAQTRQVDAIRDLKCSTNDTVLAGATFPAALRAACNQGDSVWRTADTAIEADNFRVAYDPFGNQGPIEGGAACVGACNGGRYVHHASPDQNYRNVRAAEGSRQFLDDALILGEDIIVHLPKGFNGPLEHAAGLARGAGARDVVVMLHGGGGLGEAALSQLANLSSIQDGGPRGPVLLIPNSGNSLRLDSNRWAWDAWSTTCQTSDSVRLGAGAHARFRAYPGQDSADYYDDGFDDACASDLRRLLSLSRDLKDHNAWIRRVFLGGFSSGGHMTKTVLCTYPGAYDGYAIFEHGDLIGTPAQGLCGDLDPAGSGYLGFVSGRIQSLIGAAPGDLAAAKRPLFHVCSDQDDACSDDLGQAWRIQGGVADSLVTDRALEKRAYDHTEVNAARRQILALARLPDSADLATVGRGQYDWKLSGLEFRAQTTLGAALPVAAAAAVADPSRLPPVCADSQAAYDSRTCAFADANNGLNGSDDKAYHSVLAIGAVGAKVVDPPDEILAIRFAEKANGGAYGCIEVHGGGHTVHGTSRADLGKTRDFDTFIEMLKFMNYAYEGTTAPVRPRLGKRPHRAGPDRPFDGSVRFGGRNSLGRKF